MAAVPEPIHATVAKIFEARQREADDGHRPHLGASILGRKCDRQLWYTFRWAKRETFPGRVLRLFERGQLEEARWWADLRRIGVQVHDVDPDGLQWRVSAVGGHVGGSMDAAVVGLPESPKTWHVAECKTHNAKSFADLLKKGVRLAKPEHYAQMQIYMHLTGMERAAYLATNKDNDDLYFERVEYDPAVGAALIERGEKIVRAAEPPPPISRDPSWYECKFCSYGPICHGAAVPEVNCRTCAYSTPVVEGEGGTWTCECAAIVSEPTPVPVDFQRTGCGSHRFIPILLEKGGMQVDVRRGDVIYRTAEGEEWVNGEAPGALSSKELHDLEDVRAASLAYQQKGDLARAGIDSVVVG